MLLLKNLAIYSFVSFFIVLAIAIARTIKKETKENN